MSEKKNALAVRENNTAVASMADVLSTDGMWDRICSMGKTLAQSGFLGDKVSDAGAIAAAMTMVSEGLNPVEFKRRYHIIGNTPSRTPGSLMGDFQMMGGTWKIVQADDEACEIEFTLGKQTYTSRVTMERMLKTTVPFNGRGELKANWANFPDDMLYARCCAKGLRRVAPGLMGGIYTKEEVQDFDSPSSAPRAEVNENELRYRAAMQKGPKAPEPVMEQNDAIEVETVEVPRVDAPAPDQEHAPSSEAPADCTTCPIKGDYYGLPFSEMDTDILQFLLAPECRANHPELTDDHIAVVGSVVENRIQEAEAAE